MGGTDVARFEFSEIAFELGKTPDGRCLRLWCALLRGLALRPIFDLIYCFSTISALSCVSVPQRVPHYTARLATLCSGRPEAKL